MLDAVLNSAHKEGVNQLSFRWRGGKEANCCNWQNITTVMACQNSEPVGLVDKR